jgi:hypothetical protein
MDRTDSEGQGVYSEHSGAMASIHRWNNIFANGEASRLCKVHCGVAVSQQPATGQR